MARESYEETLQKGMAENQPRMDTNEHEFPPIEMR
jgi:hypothetical protein